MDVGECRLFGIEFRKIVARRKTLNIAAHEKCGSVAFVGKCRRGHVPVEIGDTFCLKFLEYLDFRQCEHIESDEDISFKRQTGVSSTAEVVDCVAGKHAARCHPVVEETFFETFEKCVEHLPQFQKFAFE